ncbi:putative zinc ribbon protein [Dryocola clanedunensis]|uniref:putative zinc ribbon protein n=1 Tax=Dryocola clanedunensis TaxID=2925396 RepID=UPI0038CC1C48
MKKIRRARFTVTPTRWICIQCHRQFGGEKPCPVCYNTAGAVKSATSKIEDAS